jgi:hypothetical protein
LPTAIKLANGAISVYVRARTNNPNSAEGARFSFTLGEPEGSNLFFGWLIRPKATGKLQYRDSSGRAVTTDTERVVFRDLDSFIDFKLKLTPGETPDSPATAEAFYYDTDVSAYVSVGEAAGLVQLSARAFQQLSIYSRNGTDNGAAYFDSIVITQTQR